jgi:hypothetical protein
LVTEITKPGGLDSRDELRSRSRLSLVWRPDFFFLVEIFKIKTFQSRYWRVEIFVEIVETRPDCLDFSRRSKICQEILTLSKPFESENDEKSRLIEKS